MLDNCCKKIGNDGFLENRKLDGNGEDEHLIFNSGRLTLHHDENGNSVLLNTCDAQMDLLTARQHRLNRDKIQPDKDKGS